MTSDFTEWELVERPWETFWQRWPKGAEPPLGMSYQVVRETWTVGTDGVPERTIHEVRLLSVGPV